MLHHVHNEAGYNSFTIAVLGFLMTSFYFFMSGYGNTKSLMYRKIGGGVKPASNVVGILCARNEKLIKKLFDRKYIVALAVLMLIAIMAGLTILPNRPVQLLVAMVMCILIYIISIRKEVSVKLFKQIGDKSFVYYIFHAVMLNCFKVYASLNPMLYCVLVFVSTGVLVSIYYRIEKRLKKSVGIANYLKRMVRYVINGVPEYHITVEVKESAPSHQLDGKNIIVTGAGSGLGYYIAKRSIAEGAKILITGRNEDKLKKAALELGKKCSYLVFDSADVSHMSEFIKQVSHIFGGKIHGLVSNAGISLHEGNFRNVTEEGWDSQMNINLKGNYFMVKAYIEYLESLDDKNGNVVVITSERSRRSDDIPYGLTKAASNSFIECFASKVISEGIRVNGVAPGVTASDMTGVDRNGNMYANWQPSNRFFLPEEVAEVVNFLLSDVSNCISGEIIACDQGRYISHW